MRLLVWNILTFTKKRIFDQDLDPSAENPESFNYPAANRELLLDNILDGKPDIFIIIEVRSSQGKLGSLAGGGGADGVVYLLELLREQVDENWCVVPPLRLVPQGITTTHTEAIAVFFRKDILDFRGPYVWPGGNGVAIPNGNAVATGPYPQPWNNALPDKNHYAGQFKFLQTQEEENNPKEILFIEDTHRRPFLTRFVELNEPQRTITILTSHTKPKASKAATARLLRIQEIQWKNQKDNEVVIIAGDLNCDIRGNTVEKSIFGLFAMEEPPFTVHFTEDMGATMLKRVYDATPEDYKKDEGLDNIITRYGSDRIRPDDNNPIIVNNVEGSVDHPAHMTKELEEILKINFTEERNRQFRAIHNYGHIGPSPGISDHMAVSLDI